MKAPESRSDRFAGTTPKPLFSATFARTRSFPLAESLLSAPGPARTPNMTHNEHPGAERVAPAVIIGHYGSWAPWDRIWASWDTLGPHLGMPWNPPWLPWVHPVQPWQQAEYPSVRPRE